MVDQPRRVTIAYRLRIGTASVEILLCSKRRTGFGTIIPAVAGKGTWYPADRSFVGISHASPLPRRMRRILQPRLKVSDFIPSIYPIGLNFDPSIEPSLGFDASSTHRLSSFMTGSDYGCQTLVGSYHCHSGVACADPKNLNAAYECRCSQYTKEAKDINPNVSIVINPYPSGQLVTHDEGLYSR